MSKDYREPEDLLSDESFLSWYFESGKEENIPLDRWMENDPANMELAVRAKALLDSTLIREMEMPAAQLQQAEAALLQRMDPKRVPLYRNWRWIAAACILTILVAGMVITRMLPFRQQQLTTPYGQLTVQQLPDGSEVTMNANSRLRYFNAFQDGKDREVWIEGEAFFHVHKTPLKSRFIVHTDRFDIVVTGTQFNVVNRRGNANVMLREGSVVLHSSDGEDMDMVPGDFVRWDHERLEKTAVKSDSLLAWKDHRLIFDKTPLREVANIIEDQYGVRVTLQDQSIADSTITGIMQNNNLDVLLKALEITSDFNVERGNGTITIKASSH
jgi:transmembrane sensor